MDEVNLYSPPAADPDLPQGNHLTSRGMSGIQKLRRNQIHSKANIQITRLSVFDRSEVDTWN